MQRAISLTDRRSAEHRPGAVPASDLRAPRIRTVVLVALLSLSLGGCSVVRTAYNQLDWVITRYLTKHFELDDAQERELRTMVDRNLEWHRTTQLPLYSDFLANLVATMDEEVTPEQMGAAYNRTLVFWDDFMLQIVPDSQTFLANLSDEQVDQMIERLEKNNEEMYETYSGRTPEQREARRNKNTIKLAERVMGRLNDEQKDKIRESLAEMEDSSEDWVDNRRQWQVVFIELVREEPPEAEYRERLASLFVAPRDYDDPEFQAVIDRNLQRGLELTAWIVNSMTPQQRRKLNKRLLGFAEDFDRLAEQT